MYGVEERSYTPENFYAGDFPTVTESGTAAGAIRKHTPIVKNEDGKLAEVAAGTVGKLVGIAAEAAGQNEPAVYYMTGEFFADAIVLPGGVTVDAVKDELRKLSIFLK